MFSASTYSSQESYTESSDSMAEDIDNQLDQILSNEDHESYIQNT